MSEQARSPRVIEFQLDPKSAFEGMVMSGQRVFRGRGRWILMALFALQSVIIPLGFLGLYFVGYVLWFGTPPRGRTGLILFGLLGGVFGFFVNRIVYQKMARIVCNSNFGRGGRMEFDDAGLVLNTNNSEWRTGWGDVEEVLLGKRSLSIGISGIVLILPLSAFESKQQMQSVYEDVSALFEQGRSSA